MLLRVLMGPMVYVDFPKFPSQLPILELGSARILALQLARGAHVEKSTMDSSRGILHFDVINIPHSGNGVEAC